MKHLEAQTHLFVQCSYWISIKEPTRFSRLQSPVHTKDFCYTRRQGESSRMVSIASISMAPRLSMKPFYDREPFSGPAPFYEAFL
jgi:hypothetical protein